MNPLFLFPLALALAACQLGPKEGATRDLINAELNQAKDNRQRLPHPAQPDAVGQALLPPLIGGAQKAGQIAVEQRFDLVVSNASANQVFMALVSGTRYSMLVHPEVTGTISVNLKDVTVQEALETIREMYGYEYKLQGTRILILPVTLQSRVFQVNYLTTLRTGQSETRISSGSITSSSTPSTGTTTSAQPTTSSSPPGSSPTAVSNGSQILTSSKSDFWSEMRDTIKIIIGTEPGRSVVLSPQSGIIVVRALPRELRDVEQYLRASRLAVERQVMLEAKIIEVILNEGFQSGVNWAAFTNYRDQRMSAGASPSRFYVPGSLVPTTNTGAVATTTDATSGLTTPSTLGDILSTPLSNISGRIPNSPLSGALGLSFMTNSFAMLMSFLETQGAVHVLSSPRIATLNNQKAVLKVGTDDFFVTNVSTTTASTGSSSTTSPTITVQPFFSGISLDVTPQIDEEQNIILHVRPSVSVVSEKNKVINLGTAGTYQLPLASSNMNETDSIVRVRDGNIVAIGGLMEQAQTDDSAKIPGLGDVPVASIFFKQGKKSMQKREFVVLLKPTIIRSDKQWEDDLTQTRDRLMGLSPATPSLDSAARAKTTQ